MVFFDLLPRNVTINSDVYRQQLDKLNEAIAEKRPELMNRKGVVFHHVNAHTSLTTREKLPELSWGMLPHPPYSPDLAPSDYHLFFRPLQNSLGGKTFASGDEGHLVQFFANTDRQFFENEIMKLTEKWQKVIEQKGPMYR